MPLLIRADWGNARRQCPGGLGGGPFHRTMGPLIIGAADAPHYSKGRGPSHRSHSMYSGVRENTSLALDNSGNGGGFNSLFTWSDVREKIKDFSSGQISLPFKLPRNKCCHS